MALEISILHSEESQGSIEFGPQSHIGGMREMRQPPTFYEACCVYFGAFQDEAQGRHIYDKDEGSGDI